MDTPMIVLLVVLAVTIAIVVALYFLGRKAQKKKRNRMFRLQLMHSRLRCW